MSIMTDKKLVTKEIWKEIIDSFGSFSIIHLEIEGHKIELQIAFSKKNMKLSIIVYIDGWLKGNENEELKKMFWRGVKIRQ